MSGYTLSQAQIDSFKENGYLTLRGVIDMPFIEAMRKQIWAHVGSDPDDPSTWNTDKGALNGFRWEPREEGFGEHPAMKSIMAQLGGGEFRGGGGAPIIKWKDEGDWSMPNGGHIDAYGGQWYPFMIGATTYLYDVEPTGGAFIYWGKSHKSTHAYFREHPTEIDGSFPNHRIFSDASPEGPSEFVGKAGDVVLWHAFLVHNGSRNATDSPRFGIFGRWSHQKQGEIKHEIPEDLWKYWAI